MPVCLPPGTISLGNEGSMSGRNQNRTSCSYFILLLSSIVVVLILVASSNSSSVSQTHCRTLLLSGSANHPSFCRFQHRLVVHNVTLSGKKQVVLTVNIGLGPASKLFVTEDNLHIFHRFHTGQLVPLTISNSKRRTVIWQAIIIHAYKNTVRPKEDLRFSIVPNCSSQQWPKL